ncbi:MAG: hypothetical protein MUF15_10385 [Acidobacteria bacterium]|jgi:Tfp pilus assembly protein FimT|nr:hypothetical protein [Acidobacteriota bacterium]
MNNILSHKKKQQGLTLFELLAALCIFALVGMLGIPKFNASVKRWEVTGSVRTVSSALSTARYDAIRLNRSVKFCIENNRVLLKEKRGTLWYTFSTFDVDKDVSIYSNAAPVFTAIGTAAPLCTITIGNLDYQYKMTLSSAGRIKIIQVK